MSAVASAKQLDARTQHIYPILYLEDVKHADALRDLHTRLCKRARQNHRDIDGAWFGFCALDQSAHRYLRSAKDDGKLLMCWEGSTVVNLPKGGAA